MLGDMPILRTHNAYDAEVRRLPSGAMLLTFTVAQDLSSASVEWMALDPFVGSDVDRLAWSRTHVVQDDKRSL